MYNTSLFLESACPQAKLKLVVRFPHRCDSRVLNKTGLQSLIQQEKKSTPPVTVNIEECELTEHIAHWNLILK